MQWAESWAKKLIQYRGDKKTYVCAAGVTPSGKCHIGHLREALTSYFVSEALKDQAKKTRLVYVWDDYDRFRKVPKGVPTEYEKHLGKPICDIPDPSGKHDSYAKSFSEPFEEELRELDVKYEFKHASELWRKCLYSENVKTALNKKQEIKKILNKYREEELGENWWPIHVYCEECGKDTTRVTAYDGEYEIEYQCKCGHSEKIDYRKKGNLKLKWRIDWPNRWQHFSTDYESGGKDHYAAGGSRDTGNIISEKIFSYKPPLPLKEGYEFVRTKEVVGKISSSKGNVVTATDLLEVMTPELVKYVFLKIIPGKELIIGLDQDLLNTYNYYEKAQKTYYGVEKDENKQREKETKKTYQYSKKPSETKMPTVPNFSQLVTVAQLIPEEKIWGVLERMGYKQTDKQKTLQLLDKAKKWAQKHAPETMRVKILEKPQKAPQETKKTLQEIADYLEKNPDAEQINTFIYEKSKKNQLAPKKVFETIYELILGKKQGPRLGYFLKILDKEFVQKRLRGEK